MLINKAHIVIEIMLLSVIVVIAYAEDFRITNLQQHLKDTQIDVQQATERSLRAEREAQKAREMLDAIQFSTSSR